jgi:hypothetical protein
MLAGHSCVPKHCFTLFAGIPSHFTSESTVNSCVANLSIQLRAYSAAADERVAKFKGRKDTDVCCALNANADFFFYGIFSSFGPAPPAGSLWTVKYLPTQK